LQKLAKVIFLWDGIGPWEEELEDKQIKKTCRLADGRLATDASGLALRNKVLHKWIETTRTFEYLISQSCDVII